ncbi:MAG TPA: redox-regulated ATPase YchF [Chloroflexi bacterium]|jgi:GTP-binding protein YchF|nr:redox-regulated ATPase YchF [Chloroflexota bacterium]
MQVAIIGLPLSGKTTIFEALTQNDAHAGGHSAGRYRISTAIVDVPDPRVDALSALFRPRKTTYARIQFNDISGIGGDVGESKGLDAQLLTAIAPCDALLQVVRGFDNPTVPHPAGDIEPRRDLAALRFELLISDLAVVERRIERIEAGLKKSRADAGLTKELALMRRFKEALENETPLVNVEMDEEEAFMVRGFQFLTLKPAMVLLNLNDDDDADVDLAWANHHRRTSAVALKGVLEKEIARLPEEDRALFLEDYGIAAPGLEVMVRQCYDLLGLMSFFTVGEDEVRAWTVRRGATAVEAAGAIHSDLARGFIRAEVISYDEMIDCGTLAEARKRGKLRLEGKDYVVQDGDILSIRFNV